MPYTRNRKSRKFVRCVTDVTKKQGSEKKPYNAFAVCRASTHYKGKSKGIGLREYEEKNGIKLIHKDRKKRKKYSYGYAGNLAIALTAGKFKPKQKYYK